MFTAIIMNILELFTTLKPSSALFTLDCVIFGDIPEHCIDMYEMLCYISWKSAK